MGSNPWIKIGSRVHNDINKKISKLKVRRGTEYIHSLKSIAFKKYLLQKKKKRISQWRSLADKILMTLSKCLSISNWMNQDDTVPGRCTKKTPASFL